jgi:hypothetical protein
VVLVVDLGDDDVAGPELDQLVGAGAHRLKVVGRVAGILALVRGNEVLREDVAVAPDKGRMPDGGRLLKGDFDRIIVDFFDNFDIRVVAPGRGGRRRVHDVFPGEDHVVGRERLAVVPDNAFLKAPDDPAALPVQGALFDAGHLGRQDGKDLPVGIVGGQGLGENPGAVEVLGAGGEVGIEDDRRLPPEEFKQPPAAPPGGLEFLLWGLRLGRCCRGRGARLKDADDQGHGNSRPQQGMDELPPGYAPRLELFNQLLNGPVRHEPASRAEIFYFIPLPAQISA